MRNQKSKALYPHPFSKAYWHDAAAELKDTRMLVVTALMVALRIVPPQAFGVLMSLEPAVAALLGFLILGEVLSLIQWAAIVCIIAASLLVTLGRRAE